METNTQPITSNRKKIIYSIIGLALLLFVFLVFVTWHIHKKHSHPFNIILIISDQEAYRLAPASNYQLPARQTLMRHGITFKNHYTAAAMCSPSRATFLTGVPPQVNGVFDQMDYSYVPNLDPHRMNMGSALKSLGYQTAYFGKFEMDKSLLNLKDTVNSSTSIQPYGFYEFNPDGDYSGSPQQGYQNDIYFVGQAIRWLRQNVKANKNKPFFLVVSLLNPHDIMYGDANLPDTPLMQKPQAPVILPPPKNTIYAKEWHFDLPDTLNDSLVGPGMPAALNEYQIGWAGALGAIPTDRKDMWTFYYNYYLNTLRDNDLSLKQLVDAIDDMNLWKNTIVIFTADHGEMGGAHGGLRGKGPMAYEENIHIPLIIDHPDAPKAATCSALTSHLDLLPTLISLTGLEKPEFMENTHLPGHDFSSLMVKPEAQSTHAIRDAVLFNYVGISTIDGNYLLKTLKSSFSHQTLPLLTEVNVSKKGFLTVIFDGRYKYARYYAPDAFNVPETLEQILKYNDIQLFDLASDPLEKRNLALDANKNKQLILKMNKLMNDLLAKEVGANNGNFLPEVIRPKTAPLIFNK